MGPLSYSWLGPRVPAPRTEQVRKEMRNDSGDGTATNPSRVTLRLPACSDFQPPTQPSDPFVVPLVSLQPPGQLSPMG